MKYELVIRPEAEQDLTESFAWYEDKRKGLGYDFLLQVDAGLRFIARNPEIPAPALNISQWECQMTLRLPLKRGQQL